RRCESLEEKWEGAGCATKEAADAANEGNNAEEESAHGEEKTDEDESEHEASFEIVLVSPAITSSISAVHGAAVAPKGPSCNGLSVTQALGVSFKEVKLVCRVFVDSTAE
ncbi:MAG: hypothetical protein Q9198_006955, partial [Flavoplaca austrocitrina]